ncbi:MAG: hypothetical protein VW268_05110 [Rhodospirillaceae bacterium]
MGFIIAGAAILGSILGLIWLKDWLESVALQRIVHHEFTARLAVAGAVMVLAGLLIAGKDILKALGLIAGGT